MGLISIPCLYTSEMVYPLYWKSLGYLSIEYDREYLSDFFDLAIFYSFEDVIGYFYGEEIVFPRAVVRTSKMCSILIQVYCIHNAFVVNYFEPFSCVSFSHSTILYVVCRFCPTLLDACDSMQMIFSYGARVLRASDIRAVRLAIRFPFTRMSIRSDRLMPGCLRMTSMTARVCVVSSHDIHFLKNICYSLGSGMIILSVCDAQVRTREQKSSNSTVVRSVVDRVRVSFLRLSRSIRSFVVRKWVLSMSCISSGEKPISSERILTITPW